MVKIGRSVIFDKIDQFQPSIQWSLRVIINLKRLIKSHLNWLTCPWEAKMQMSSSQVLILTAAGPGAYIEILFLNLLVRVSTAPKEIVQNLV